MTALLYSPGAKSKSAHYQVSIHVHICIKGLLINVWPKVEEDELYSSRYIHMQSSSLNDYAEGLKLMTFFMVFLFQVIQNRNTHTQEGGGMQN